MEDRETSRSSGSSESGDILAPRVALLLPVVLVLHVAEEWLGGFPAWTGRVLDGGVSPERFVVINTFGVILLTTGTVVASSTAGVAWFVVSFASLLVLNGVLHSLATLGWGLYSPGTITGLLLSIPIGLAVLRASWPRLPTPVFVGAALFGVVIHGVVTLIALS